MALFKFFTRLSHPEPSAPDEFDALAAIARVASVKDRSSAFYQKHRLFVEECLEFLKSIRAQDRELGLLLRSTQGPFDELARGLRDRLGESSQAAGIRKLLHSGIAALLPRMAVLLDDTSHPGYLDDCERSVRAHCEQVGDPAGAQESTP